MCFYEETMWSCGYRRKGNLVIQHCMSKNPGKKHECSYKSKLIYETIRLPRPCNLCRMIANAEEELQRVNGNIRKLLDANPDLRAPDNGLPVTDATIRTIFWFNYTTRVLHAAITNMPWRHLYRASSRGPPYISPPDEELPEAEVAQSILLLDRLSRIRARMSGNSGIPR